MRVMLLYPAEFMPLRHLLNSSVMALVATGTVAIASAHAADPPTKATSNPLNGSVSKQKSVRTPRHHIEFTPAMGAPQGKHSSNTFSDISQSLPAAAVKEDLARKHELPSAQTAVLRPGAPAGTPMGTTGGSAPSSSAATSGSSPEILSPGKVAIPETHGSTDSAFR
ncbi:MAG TPA: hypothetical protein V6C97_17805 [Oculatellaceae cyanobacterium]